MQLLILFLTPKYRPQRRPTNARNDDHIVIVIVFATQHHEKVRKQIPAYRHVSDQGENK